MKNEFQIKVGETDFQFFIDENNWCKIFIPTEKEQFYLGADEWDVIAQKFRKILSEECNSYEDERIMSFSETPYSLYRRKNGDAVDITWWRTGDKIRYGITIDVPQPTEILRNFE